VNVGYPIFTQTQMRNLLNQEACVSYNWLSFASTAGAEWRQRDFIGAIVAAFFFNAILSQTCFMSGFGIFSFMILYDFAERVGKPQQLWTMRLVSFLCDFRQDQGLRPCSQVSCSSELAAPAGTILVAFNFFRCHPRKINQDLHRFIKYQTKHQ